MVGGKALDLSEQVFNVLGVECVLLGHPVELLSYHLSFVDVEVPGLVE